MKRVLIRALIVVAAILGIVLAQVAPASATPTKKLPSILGASWTTVLQLPADESPFGSGGPESGCVDLGGTLAPGWPFGFTGPRSCTVKPGTKIFVSASSFECSTIPGDDHPATPPPFTEADLQKCATDLNSLVNPTAAPKVTLDGRPVTLTRVVTSAQHIVLPENNIFGADPNPPEGYLSAADGWVALLNPLTPGTHEIKILVNGGEVFPENTTTIVVKPGH